MSRDNSKYGTEVMKNAECLLFLETALENGLGVEDAIQDMRMIDNLLAVERSHLLSFGEIKRTKSGHYRKGTMLADCLDSVVSARARSVEM